MKIAVTLLGFILITWSMFLITPILGYFVAGLLTIGTAAYLAAEDKK